MSVYVDHAPAGVEIARTVVWSRLWADTVGEAQEFTARLGVTWHTGQTVAVISEGNRRRAILMGAIPVATAPAVARAVVRGVAA
jgi:hypothetical protein